MQLNRESNSAHFQIENYTENSITINQQVYSASIILMPNHLANWHVTNILNLSPTDLQQLLKLEPELILLGCGAYMQLPPVELLATINTERVEFMSNASAIRTYTALIAEDRIVMLALMLP